MSRLSLMHSMGRRLATAGQSLSLSLSLLVAAASLTQRLPTWPRDCVRSGAVWEYPPCNSRLFQYVCESTAAHRVGLYIADKVEPEDEAKLWTHESFVVYARLSQVFFFFNGYCEKRRLTACVRRVAG